jgi:hypothetical protein
MDSMSGLNAAITIGVQRKLGLLVILTASSALPSGADCIYPVWYAAKQHLATLKREFARLVTKKVNVPLEIRWTRLQTENITLMIHYLVPGQNNLHTFLELCIATATLN